MKKLIFAALITLMIAGCNQAEKKSNTSVQKDNSTTGNGDEMKATYEANLAAYKSQIAAFEKEDINTWAATIADNAVWHSPAYGDTGTSKAHWVESIKNIMDNNSNLHLTDAQFLPGVDSATQKPDGSVRYYGTWHASPTGGKEVSIKFYGTYDFNSDHKIISGDEYYDVGGLRNAVTPKK
ncbi:MAG: nuclear transport factor 2 family protein [Ginsengibacter sp.]